ncbi:MAG: amidohydrolase family protein [Wenzhouxiangella sp.]|nr:amidohydrolase family protein [Wenzhouxiangella sp.]
MSSISLGKLADFVVLSDNPMTVPEEALASLKIVRTIKEDQVVYSRPVEQVDRVSPASFGIVQFGFGHSSVPGVSAVHGDGCLNQGLSLLHHGLARAGMRRLHPITPSDQEPIEPNVFLALERLP